MFRKNLYLFACLGCLLVGQQLSADPGPLTFLANPLPTGEGCAIPDYLKPYQGPDEDRFPDEVNTPLGFMLSGHFVRRLPQGGYEGVDGAVVKVAYQVRYSGQWVTLRRETITNKCGEFTMAINRVDPADVKVEISLENGKVKVQDDDLIEDDLYRWTLFDGPVSGATLDLGAFHPSTDNDNIAIHIHNTLTRAWRWVFRNSNYNAEPGRLKVSFPSGDDENEYDGGKIEVATRPYTHDHMMGMHQTLLRLYGIFLLDDQARLPSGVDCGGGTSCGDIYCGQDAPTALAAGFAEWFRVAANRDWPRENGTVIALTKTDVDRLEYPDKYDKCSASAYVSPGRFAALLWDLVDEENFNTPGNVEADRTTMSVMLVLELFTLYAPESPLDFIYGLRQQTGVVHGFNLKPTVEALGFNWPP